jgi:hypothetical protein
MNGRFVERWSARLPSMARRVGGVLWLDFVSRRGELNMTGFWNWIGIIWCRLAHPAATWQRHGHYHCPKCLRLYIVPWERTVQTGPSPGDDPALHEA